MWKIALLILSPWWRVWYVAPRETSSFSVAPLPSSTSNLHYTLSTSTMSTFKDDKYGCRWTKHLQLILTSVGQVSQILIWQNTELYFSSQAPMGENGFCAKIGLSSSPASSPFAQRDKIPFCQICFFFYQTPSGNTGTTGICNKIERASKIR